jgi:hypothetical protein
MAGDRTALRATAAAERRPSVATIIHRSAASPGTGSPAQALQHRLGNHATQLLIARSIATVGQVVPPSVQLTKTTRLPANVEAARAGGTRGRRDGAQGRAHGRASGGDAADR